MIKNQRAKSKNLPRTELTDRGAHIQTRCASEFHIPMAETPDWHLENEDLIDTPQISPAHARSRPVLTFEYLEDTGPGSGDIVLHL